MDNERKPEPEPKSSTEEILATGPLKDDCDLVCNDENEVMTVSAIANNKVTAINTEELQIIDTGG